MARVEDLMMITWLGEQFEAWQATLGLEGTATLEAIDDGRKPSAARIVAESPGRLVHATLWSSGEVDLVVGDRRTGQVLKIEHQQLSGPSSIAGLLDSIRAALAG